eukprot:TRINITY_DN11456_c1_g3_i1.p1 TRINITY_DN11456_c1_g3~~TRINITY_DN11456_c1_g3_i1.p1  ORF type:complete len:889 (+),score=222.67 TRINITY_DN11456_c1_g3_i1:1-2667(+)
MASTTSSKHLQRVLLGHRLLLISRHLSCTSVLFKKARKPVPNADNRDAAKTNVLSKLSAIAMKVSSSRNESRSTKIPVRRGTTEKKDFFSHRHDFDTTPSPRHDDSVRSKGRDQLRSAVTASATRGSLKEQAAVAKPLPSADTARPDSAKMDGATSSSTASSTLSAPPYSQSGALFDGTREPDKIDVKRLQGHIAEDWSKIRAANLRLSNIQEPVTRQQPASTQTTVMLSLLGNITIASAKFYAYSRTGHSAMFSEAVHTMVDVGNQAILSFGLREAERQPDKSYQYGYGRAAFFYSLLTALSTFGFGALYTLYQGVHVLIDPHPDLQTLPETWAILGVSFLVDGFVLRTALRNTKRRAASAGLSVRDWLMSFKDPFTVAVVLEDSAAVAGVAIAAAGIGLTQVTGNPVYDGIATICISGLLAAVSFKLIQLNHSFILGKKLDDDVERTIRRKIKQRVSVDEVHSEQSQWMGAATFSYKAEVDFDGTWLAAQLFNQYEQAFLSTIQQADEEALRKALTWLLPAFAEDLTRVLEREVRDIQKEIRRDYPEAAYVEIVPDSSQTTMSALETMLKLKLSRQAEEYQLNSILATTSDTTDNVVSSPLHLEYFKLASVYMSMGQYEKAIPQLRQCLELREQQMGPDSVAVASVLDRLAMCYLSVNDMPRATNVINRGARLIQKLDWDTAPLSERTLIASFKSHLGHAFRASGQALRAVPHLEEALRLRRLLHDETHSSVTELLSSLADIFTAVPSRRGRAMEYYKQLIAAYEQAYGPNNMRLAKAYDRLAKAQVLAELRRRAIESLDKAVAIKRSLPTSGYADLELADSLFNLGNLLMKEKRYMDAMLHLEQALTLRQTHGFRLDSAEVSPVLYKLRIIYHKIGRPVPEEWQH